MSGLEGGGDLLIGAVALWLVLEGLLPFLSPRLWRTAFERALLMTDQQLRFFGLCCMLVGLLLLVAFLN